ncbi:hypothetical protein [uncultured Microbacterium sp.]|uniref:hypothetical protein n=1 Tax=uncultured Microbacterium sp. TaxID=191216 RepID=UPI0025DA0094|nr:hypothetical protein [uncultured Microbacterium sp.]
MNGLRSGELFAGVGGLGMAVDAVFGSDPAWFCEFDAAPSRVLAHHFPAVPNYGDVTLTDVKLLSTPDTVPEAPNTGSNSAKAGNVVGLGNQVMSLLPTPRTTDMNGAGAHGAGGLDLRTTVALLPTPMVGSSSPAAHGQISGDFRARMDQVIEQVTMMPTPRASRGGSATETMYGLGAVRDDEGDQQGNVTGEVSSWGPYAAAIERWEAVVGRTAPAPVRMDGKGGKARLNPELTEWMMGWPAGWVTASAQLSRAEQLKACGNGVVPQQAAAALRMLLARPGVPSIRRAVAA